MNIRRKYKELEFDFAVVGGGLTGMCAAIAAARHGARTVLIHDRPVFGGNASSEVRMHICGASANGLKKDAEETGIIHELILDNKRVNDYFNFSRWDSVLFQKIKSTDNLTALLNCSMQELEMDGERLSSVSCYQLTTEINYKIKAKIFADCTGNGTLSYFAGCGYRCGCEGRAEFDEPDAPETPNKERMGNTLLFKAVDRGHPVPFESPEWARHFSEDDLKFRKHGNAEANPFFCFGVDYGYWWIELPGSEEDFVSEYEDIRDELVRCVYGIWDHMKNEGDHGAENLDLEWVGMLPGIREGRRVEGKYILNENDVLSNRRFPDAVAYGGWPVDNHAPRGLFDKDREPAFVRQYPGFYTIPYRCYLNASVPNLMQGGRALSASKLAMASTRVMGTCAVGGQAMGTAAALCIEKGLEPEGLLPHIAELQQLLLKDDCYIPGVKNEDAADLARSAAVTASSERPGCEAANVINGVSRNEEGVKNLWQSAGISPEGEALTLSLESPSAVSQVRLSFDSNLSLAKKVTLSAKRQAEQQIGVPAELVRDFSVTLWSGERQLARKDIAGNFQRLCVVDFEKPVFCDRVEIRVTATNGSADARIFEVRVYDTAK